MARSTIYVPGVVTIDDTRFLAVAKYLRDDTGTDTRAKGGIWVSLDAPDARAHLASAREAAAAFVAMADKLLANTAAPAPKPAPASKPAPATAPTNVRVTAVARDGKPTLGAKLGIVRPAAPITHKPAPASKPAPKAPATAEPAFDWGGLTPEMFAL